MKRIICLLVMVLTMLTASVCSAATVAGGNTKYFDRCRVSVSTTGNKVWNYIENTSKSIKCFDREKFSLSYVFALPTKAKSLIVELSYDTSSATGQGYRYVSKYYLEII